MSSNDEFYNKLSATTKGRLCFRDGVLDLPTKKFHKWDAIPFEFYSTQMIDSEVGNYLKNPNQMLAKHIYDTIMVPLFEDKTDDALHYLARALGGHSEDKNWATFLGRRDCGKGVIYDALSATFGPYVCSFDLGNILYQRKREDISETSRKSYWMLDLEFKRLAISQEVPDDKSSLIADGKLIKKLMSGGDVQIARRNYDREDTHFRLDISLFPLGNAALKVDSEDVFEHCLQLTSCRQFKTAGEIELIKENAISPLEYKGLCIGDPTIKDRVKTAEWRNALITLIMDSYKDTPVHIRREAGDEGDTYTRKILECYEITRSENDIILAQTVADKLDDSIKKITPELKCLGVEKRKIERRGEFRGKVCFVGLKLIKDEAEVGDTDTEFLF
jgi:hypothetical protein